jgi:hypothetical protein
MPRIRTIQPDIAEDERLGKCSRDARLTFILCITIADDAGIFRGSDLYLRHRLFPYDDETLTAESVGSWLAELVAVGLVRIYEADGETFAELVGWAKNQRLDNAGRSKYPAAPSGLSVTGDDVTPATRNSSPRNSAEFRGSPLEGERRGEERKGGERRKQGTRARDADPCFDGHGAGRKSSPPVLSTSAFGSVWDSWPAVKRQRPTDAEAAWNGAVSETTEERLLESATAWLRYWDDEKTPTRWIPRLDRWLRNGDWKYAPPSSNGDEARLERKRAVVEDFLNEGGRP